MDAILIGALNLKNPAAAGVEAAMQFAANNKPARVTPASVAPMARRTFFALVRIAEPLVAHRAKMRTRENLTRLRFRHGYEC
jgi:hypothetical protein